MSFTDSITTNKYKNLKNIHAILIFWHFVFIIHKNFKNLQYLTLYKNSDTMIIISKYSYLSFDTYNKIKDYIDLLYKKDYFDIWNKKKGLPLSYYDIYKSYSITINFNNNIFKLIIINDDSYKNNLIKNIRLFKKNICNLLNIKNIYNYNLYCKKLNNNMVSKYKRIMNEGKYDHSISLYSNINKIRTYYHNIMNVENFNETVIKYYSDDADDECDNC